MPKALVVDDSRAMRMILARTLRGAGLEVAEAASGKEALEVLGREAGSVRLILIDWNMPAMSGLEVVKEVRSRRELDAVRLVMVTTETGVEQMSQALTAGANEYLMKPFTQEAVESKLRLLGILE